VSLVNPLPQARNYQRINVQPRAGALGAQISGVDLSAAMDDALFAEIKQAFHDHLVIVLRKQSIKPQDLVAFAKRFGPVESHPLGSRRGLEDHPEVMVLENKAGKLGPRNDFWHSDISFGVQPPLGSILYAITVTEGRADTMFCNMYRAYEGLSAGLRDMLDKMTAMHSAEKIVQEVPNRFAVDVAPPAVEHPVVRTHIGTGRKALYVNPHYTLNFKNWTREDSEPLLKMLAARATAAENIYRHQWQVGDVLMWDNRCTMHYAVRDYDDSMPRFMHRTTAAGDIPH
jgi:taurine dioxygenase